MIQTEKGPDFYSAPFKKVPRDNEVNMKRKYRSKNGLYDFDFVFKDKGSYIEIFCTHHPGFNGKSSNPEKTHLFRSGKLCFVSGREPTSQYRAEELAAQWAEYFLEYRRTGKTQS